MASPFKNVAKSISVIDTVSKASTNLPAITYDMVEKIGSGVSEKSKILSENMISAVSVADMGNLGDLLVEFHSQANKLDLNKYVSGGFIGKLINGFRNIKETMIANLQSASESFRVMEVSINDNIKKTRDLVVSLDNLNNDNYKQYQSIEDVLTVTNKYIKALEPTLSQASGDMFGAQDVRSTYQALLLKKDMFERLKVVSECNGPQIIARRDAARVRITMLDDMLNNLIPSLKLQYSLAISDIESKKSGDFINELRTLANKTLTSSAETGSAAQLGNAVLNNNATIETNTLLLIQNKLKETIAQVRNIEDTYQTKAKEAQTALESNRQDLLKELSK